MRKKKPLEADDLLEPGLTYTINPTEFGWFKNDSGNYEFNWFHGPQLPESVKDIMIESDGMFFLFFKFYNLYKLFYNEIFLIFS